MRSTLLRSRLVLCSLFLFVVSVGCSLPDTPPSQEEARKGDLEPPARAALHCSLSLIPREPPGTCDAFCVTLTNESNCDIAIVYHHMPTEYFNVEVLDATSAVILTKRGCGTEIYNNPICPNTATLTLAPGESHTARISMNAAFNHRDIPFLKGHDTVCLRGNFAYKGIRAVSEPLTIDMKYNLPRMK